LLSFLQAELLECARISGALRGVENLNADDAAFVVVIDDNAIGDFFAVLDARSVRLR